MTDLLPGHLLDQRFLLEEQVSLGGGGTLYRAVDMLSATPVAVKVPHRHPEDTYDSAKAEAARLLGLQTPSIVRLLAQGTIEGDLRPYLVFEWLDGHTLRAAHELEGLSVVQALCLGILISRALEYLHERGIIHCDLKPENIFLKQPPSLDPLSVALGAEPILIDFGSASSISDGRMGGTAAYMSPEQARGEALLDHRSDIYSLGATLFHLLAGAPPHLGPSQIATLAKTATTPAPRLSLLRPGISRRLDDLIDRMLRTERTERPENAKEVTRKLESCLREDPPSLLPEDDTSSQTPPSLSRLVTTLVAIDVKNQERTIARLVTNGALVAPIGRDAAVGYWGALRATGGETHAAMLVARRLAQSEARVGIATGRARLVRGARAIQPVGEVVDRAVSLAREAPLGQVLVDSTTGELGRGRFEFRFRDDGSAFLGSPSQIPRERAGGAPFVGREAEVARIVDAYDRSVLEQSSTIVLLAGPPGIGKSRLRREVVARLSGRADAPRVVVERSDAYGQRHVLGTAADILRNLLRLSKGASSGEAERALLESLGPETMSEATNDSRRLLAQLLVNESVPEVSEQADLRDALWLSMTDLLTRTLSNEPIALILEDLQWADAESILWLDHVLGRSTRRPLFVLACVRPSYFQDHSGRFAGRALRIDLRPISKAATIAIARSLLGPAGEETEAVRIAEQSGGSPLFAEELARLAFQGRGGVQAPTIEIAIQASLDALEPNIRDALGRASVLGLAVWEGALGLLDVTNPKAALRELVFFEFLTLQETSRFPNEKEYLFKHALVRDVAYSELPDELKVTLHAQAGNWLAARGEDAATVAAHMDRGNLPELASRYWVRASERALSANALHDAFWMAERALAFAETTAETFERAALLDEVWSRLDPRAADRSSAIAAMEQSATDAASRLRASGARARYLDARGSDADVGAMLQEAKSRAEALEDWVELDRTLAALATRAAFAGDFETAEATIQNLLDPSRVHSRGAQVDAFQALAVVRHAQGAVYAALEARKNAAAAARRAGLKEREAILTTNLGFALSTMGARLDARETLERGLSLADAIGSPAARRNAQMNLLGFAAMYGSDRRLDALLAETRSLADETATLTWVSSDRANLGNLYYRGVELLNADSPLSWSRARTLLELSTTQYQRLGHNDLLPVALGQWAEAERRSQKLERARALAEEAAGLIDAGAPSLLNEAPIYLALHRTFSDLGLQVAAENAIERALSPLSRRLNALSDSPYARSFLTSLPENAELVAIADALGLLPFTIHGVLSA